jgi:hypothetical protein
MVKPPCALYQGKFLLVFEENRTDDGNVQVMYQRKPKELV